MRKKNETTHTMVCECCPRVRTAYRVRGRRRASYGAVKYFVSEFLIRVVVKCHLSEAGQLPPGRRVRSSESSLCVVRPVRVVVCGPPGGRAGGRASVAGRRVILLRCRIRGPTGPANLCTGGRLPSNGGICIRSQSGAAGGHVARTQC